MKPVTSHRASQPIDSIADLRNAWVRVRTALSRDIAAADRLAADPAGVFRALGFELSPGLTGALQQVLP